MVGAVAALRGADWRSGVAPQSDQTSKVRLAARSFSSGADEIALSCVGTVGFFFQTKRNIFRD